MAAATLLIIGSAVAAPISNGWRLQSSEAVHATGATLSTLGFDDSNWYPLKHFPATVLAGLQQSNEYPGLFESQNMRDVDFYRFAPSWWYRVEVDVPTSRAEDVSQLTLVFKGINYRANVWIDSTLVATNTSLVGTFRYFELAFPRPAQPRFALAVEVFRPFCINAQGGMELTCMGRKGGDCVDLAISWVDWSVTPPDVNMGLWREVLLEATGMVKLGNPMVATQLDRPATPGARPTAHLSVLLELSNLGDAPVAGTVRCTLRLGGSGRVLALEHDVSVPAHARNFSVVLSNATHSELDVRNATDELWWVWQMGSPTMSTLEASFTTAGSAPAAPSDTLKVGVGLRQISQTLDSRGNLLVSVNGLPLLIRGGGWAPDLLQRMSAARHAQEIALVRHLGLNTIRLEGKFQDEDLFEQADRAGLLMMPGLCCCDAWQQWDDWGAEQHEVARESLRSQLKRLRRFASVGLFFYSSDDLPPKHVEQEFLDVFADERWAMHAGRVGAASDGTSPLSGPTGVKMSGPYGWVPPQFWLDDRGMSRQFGPAFGFNTETSPGGSPLTRASLEKTIPPSNRWDAKHNTPTDDWDYHCGSEYGSFGSLKHFTPGLEARLGKPHSYPEYLAKAQLEAYETHRAMFEGYSRQKYTATGVVQWMLNNGWPEHMWHLYDYYLDGGGAFYGAKAAMAPLQLIYTYQDHSIWLINSRYAPSGPLVASVELFALDGTRVYHSGPLPLNDGIAADGTKQVHRVHAWPSDGSTRLLRLLLTDAATGALVGRNEYWVPDQIDEYTLGDWLNWADISSYADMTDLQALPELKLAVGWHTEPDPLDATRSVTTVNLTNPSSHVAFFTHVRALRPDGTDVLPALWEDNFVVILLAGESRTLRVSWSNDDGPIASVEATPYNNMTGAGPSPPSPALGSCSSIDDMDTSESEYASTAAPTLGDCCTACLDDKSCHYAAYAEEMCYLKSATKGPDEGFTPISQLGVTLIVVKHDAADPPPPSPPPSPAPGGSCSSITDTDTAEDEYKSTSASSLGDCCAACVNDESCHYAAYAEQVCYLKSATKGPEKGFTPITRRGVTLILASRDGSTRAGRVAPRRSEILEAAE